MGEQGGGSRVRDTQTEKKTWKENRLFKEREDRYLRGKSSVARHNSLRLGSTEAKRVEAAQGI